MRHTFLFWLSFMLLVTFTSCREDNEIVIEAPEVETPEQPEAPVYPDGAALATFIDDNLENRLQLFTLDASSGGYIHGEEGTVLQFTGNSLVKENGDVVSGNVDIELIEVYKKSDMVLTNKSTMGLSADGQLTALKSGGQFYVNVTQDGHPLKPKSGYTIIAPVDNTGGADDKMKIFEGVEQCASENEDCDLVWQEVPGTDRGVGVDGFQTASGYYNAYYCFQQKFGWTNIDRWYNDPREKTTIHVAVPEGFDNTNCAVFMAYKGNAALAMFDVFDEETKLFTEHYGLVPIGLEVHFILVSIIEDEIHYAVQSATITKDHKEVISEVTSITKEELIDLIDELP
jgi:hypothetical protein